MIKSIHSTGVQGKLSCRQKVKENRLALHQVENSEGINFLRPEHQKLFLILNYEIFKHSRMTE